MTPEPPATAPTDGSAGAQDASGEPASESATGGQSGEPGEGRRPGVREQLSRVRVAAKALIDAHLALLRAELAVIGAQLQQIAAFVGGIVVLALYAVALLAIGGTLFLGEWLFGSIGWGVLHGLLVSAAIIVVLALLIIEAPRSLITRPFAWGVLLGVVVTLVFGLNVIHGLALLGGEQAIAAFGLALEPGQAAALVGLVVGAVVVGLVGLVAGARSSGVLGAISGLIVGALVGALVGLFFGGFTFGWQGAAAIGVTLALVTWIALMGWRASQANLDPQARFEKLWPRETYETALETKAWLEQEWTNRLSRRGSR